MNRNLVFSFVMLVFSLAGCQWFEDPPYTATGLLNDEFWEINTGPYYEEMSRRPDTLSVRFIHLEDVKEGIPDYQLILSGIPKRVSGDTIRLTTVDASNLGAFPSADQFVYYQEYGVTRGRYVLDETQDNWLWFRIEANGDMVGSFQITMEKTTAQNDLPERLAYRQTEFTANGPE